MIDTHAHVHDPKFDPDREAMLARARAAGIEAIVTIGCDLADSRRALDVAQTYGLAASIGIHPHEAATAPADIATAFDELAAGHAERIVAIGETGFDYYYNHSPAADQRRVLIAHIDYARRKNLPLVFHVRDAFADFVAVLREHFDPATMRGVIHCFTGTDVEAYTFVNEFGLKLGIGGVVTFKTADPLRAAIRAVGLDHLILETDCPYLAPVPHRGQRNEPAFLVESFRRVADELGCEPDDVARRTTENARRLFCL